MGISTEQDSSQSINEAMKLLNCALCARKVYWAEHPSAVTPLQNAAKILTQLLASVDSIVVVALQDRVVAGDQELACGQDLLSGLFGLLRARGTQSLTFRRGVSVAELSDLLAQVSIKDAAGPIPSSANLKLGCVGAMSNQSAGVALHNLNLKEVWVGLMHQGVTDRDLLDAAATNISTNLRNSVGNGIALSALQTHDNYTFVHSTNVAVLAAALGEAVGLSAPLVHDLTIAALVHDVGKLRVSKSVLNKNGRLSSEEFSAVARHPSEGASILFGARELPPIAAIVAYEHHMHPDGSGYPRIKIGRQMQLASQIVQIADVFDALRTNRPYRGAVAFDETCAIMYKDIRRFYDPDLLDTFFASVATRVDSCGVGPAPLQLPVPAPSLVIPGIQVA